MVKVDFCWMGMDSLIGMINTPSHSGVREVLRASLAAAYGARAVRKKDLDRMLDKLVIFLIQSWPLRFPLRGPLTPSQPLNLILLPLIALTGTPPL